MNKTWVLIKREFLSRVKTKGFIIGTLALPVLVFVIMGVQIAVQSMGAKEKKTLALMDLTGRIAPAFIAYMDTTYQDAHKTPLYSFERIQASPESLQAVQARYGRRIREEKIHGLIILPEDLFNSNRFELHAKNISNMEFNNALERSLSRVISDLRLQQSGIDQELVRKLTRGVELSTFKVSEAGSRQESSEMAFGVSYVMMFILYMALLFYGQFVMRGVYEDKNSRVMEVVLSSTRADQIMAGKIIGIGGAGLLQFLIWAIVIALVSTYGAIMMTLISPGTEKLAIPTISASVYLFFFLFFILGYFIYATLYATLGSMVNDEADAQSLQWPVTFLIILGFIFMFYVLNNPNSTAAVILSLIPFFTPLLMFLRLSVGAAPLWQVLLSIVIMIVTIAGLIRLTGRIFRVGILMYGKKPNLPELMKWIRYS
ncbi:MAG TPA: ABC transporter permease [bacterium]|nr:ABC transporter permease [bacterium]HQI47035.1 ABC transporter permease [bacterium]HQJ65726.1 ABC transporter permease [bacterium]